MVAFRLTSTLNLTSGAGNGVNTAGSENPTAPLVATGDQQIVQLTTGTTTFQDDGNVVQQEIRIATPYLGIKPHDSSSIADFLAKPQLLGSGLWATADLFESQLYSLSIASALEGTSYWSNKMQGYKLVRGTAVVKVNLNATPFHQGKLILTFLPCYRHLSTSQTASMNSMMAQITTQPNIELDASESSVEMRIPYVTPVSWYDRVSDDYDWGTIFLFVLAPLKTGAAGTQNVGYDIFLSFEDFECTAPFSVQSSRSISTRRSVRKEKERANKGIVAGSLESVADAADALGDIFGYIPGSKAVATVARSASDMAALFGFSKPTVAPASTDVVSNPFRYIQNYSGLNNAPSLSYSHDQHIPDHSGLFGHDMDEMSFAYLKTIPGLSRVFTWSTSGASNQLLLGMDVSPATVMSSKTSIVTGSSVIYRAGSPLFMLHRFFGAYRGGIIMTLKFAKTKMHTGRLQIAFECLPGSDPGISVSTLTLREIVDIRESDSISLRLPYMFGENYLNLLTAGTEATHDSIDAMGRLSIRILSELRSPEAAAQDIDCLVYFQPDCDFEYAGIGVGNLAPFTVQGSLDIKFEAQAGLYNEGHLVAKGIGDSSCTLQSAQPNFLSFGDPILSTKQLLLCGRPITFNLNPFSSNNVGIWPSATAMYTNSGIPANPVLEPVSCPGGGYMAMIKSGFAFEKGGYRLTNVSNLSNSTRTYLVPVTAALTTAVFIPSSEQSVQSEYYNIQPYSASTSQRGTMDVNVPGWQRANFRLTKFVTPTDLSGPSSSNSCDFNYLLLVYQDSALPTRGWTRSVTDDFCLGYFKGFAPYCLPRPT